MKLHPFIPILALAACSSCSSSKIVTSDEQSVRNEITKNYTSFFDAENARVLGDSKQALILYTDFVKKHPKNATARYNLARLQFQKMDLGDAEKNAEYALKVDPENKYFRELYTQVLVINKKSGKAESQYDILLEKYPRNEEYLYDKAMLQILMKNFDGAIRSFDKLESSLGFNEDIILQKKDLYVLQGKSDLAIREVLKLKQEDRSSSKYDLLIADIYSDSKQQEKVKEVFGHIETEYPDDPLAQMALAQYYLEQGSNAKYNHYMQMVMKNKNLEVDTKIALIIPAIKKMETDTLQRDEVIRMVRSIAEEASGGGDAQSLYADVLYFSKKYEPALEEYRKYLVTDKKRFSVWSQMISIYSERQQLDSVISVSKQCIEEFPKNAIPYFYAGISLLQQKETDSALRYLNLGLPLEKENKLLISQFYSSLGDVYNTQKKYQFSDSCFEKAIELQPTDATAMNNYAYYLSLRKERLEMAERISKKSLELQPSSKSFLDTYGWILFQQGNYKRAQEFIQKAIDANGENDGTLFEHLGDTYYKLGNAEKAIDNWKKAKEKGESNPLLLKKIQDGKYYE